VLYPKPLTEHCFVDCSKDAAACPLGTTCTILSDGCAVGVGPCETYIGHHEICAGPGDLDESVAVADGGTSR
jgi:hypothetical protein